MTETEGTILQPAEVRRVSRFNDYLELTKPRLTMLSALTDGSILQTLLVAILFATKQQTQSIRKFQILPHAVECRLIGDA